jgi:hypothetical protein
LVKGDPDFPYGSGFILSVCVIFNTSLSSSWFIFSNSGRCCCIFLAAERSALSLSFIILRAVWNSNVSRLAISRWLSFGLIEGDLGFKVLSNF